MDISPIVSNILTTIVWLIPISIVVAFFKSTWFKGKTGEAIVNFTISLALDKNIYRLIKNVTLPAKDGTTQIDHIIVSKFGIFVVETKNLKGWVFGKVTQRKWTQVNYKKRTQFQNPLHQNYKHIKTLESLLGLDSDKIFSLIVFVGESEFKTKMPENVIRPKGYINYIKSKSEMIYTDRQINQIINAIESERVENTIKNNYAHKQYVKNLMAIRKAL